MALKVLELFGGIGACTQALKLNGVDIEIADYVEIDKYAVKSYNAINGTDFEPQDITKWDKDIDVDLIMHGSPCQDFSLAGNQRGGDEGSGTRSSLMYETLRIVEKLHPTYVIWENVKNVLSKNHKHNFDKYVERMNDLGYESKWQVLNAKDYGVPQNRERVFVVSVRGVNFFEFPEKEELKIWLKDVLETNVDEKFYLSDEQVDRIKNTSYRQDRDRLQTKDYCRTNLSRDWKDPCCIQEVARTVRCGGRGSVDDKHSWDVIVYPTAYDEQNAYLRTDGCVGTLTTDGSSPKHNNRVVEPKVDLIGNIYGDKVGTSFAGNVYNAEQLSPRLNTMGGGNRQPMIEVVGNYSPSNHNASRIDNSGGLAPTVMENHGTVTGVVVSELPEN